MSLEITPVPGEVDTYELDIHLMVDDIEAERFARLFRKMGWDEDAEEIEMVLHNTYARGLAERRIEA